MKFSINREALLEPLQVVTNVVERRQTLPILSNLLIAIEDNTLSMTGTDQEVELIARTDAFSSDEVGEITVPARKLLDICKSLPQAAIVDCSLKEGRLAIKSGTFKSQLATLPVVDFPNVEMDSYDVTFVLAAGVLQQLLDKTSFALAQQDVRYFFNGLLLEAEGSLVRFVATNGQRLATSYVDEVETGSSQQFIVPRKGVNELSRLVQDGGDQEVKMSFSSNHMQVHCAQATLTSKLIDATYPDYTRAIPEGGDKILVGDRLLIKEALSRTAILSNELYRNVRLLLEPGKLGMHANNPMLEEAEETVTVDYSGLPLEIGFNVGYLIETLTVMQGEKVRMELTDANSACLLTDPDDINSRYVISPMML
ncbi:MAG: DNA polymerase III subunit beta [Gammaproteobacteria bacterium]|jgi:DNA polymerase-3 subunit beta|nr:DNA polymerase III subunit beta [Gammaproteobacteria bacterium]|tara:strand:- start:290 stop:1393 length:1104 start_codon:yes stop_codon:yes gene_type:complete